MWCRDKENFHPRVYYLYKTYYNIILNNYKCWSFKTKSHEINIYKENNI
jgi:hypothetical protein